VSRWTELRRADSWIAQWQAQLEISAATGNGGHGDPTAHRLHQQPHHSQPKPATPAVAVGSGRTPHKALKDRSSLLGLNTWPTIADMPHHLIRIGAQFQFYWPY
jgi:hypothetical protein